MGVLAGDVPTNGGHRILILLLENNGTADVGFSTEDGDYNRLAHAFRLLRSVVPDERATPPANIFCPPVHAGLVDH